MSGWASEPAASASRRRRSFASSRRSSGQSSASERSFSATTAFVRSSTARYTVAVAPRPSCCWRRKWWNSWPGRNVRPRDARFGVDEAAACGFSLTATDSGLPKRGFSSPDFLPDPPVKPRSHPPRLESSGMRGPIRSHPDPWIINGPWSHRNGDGPNFQKLMAKPRPAPQSGGNIAPGRVLASPLPGPDPSMAKPARYSSVRPAAPMHPMERPVPSCGEWNTLAAFAGRASAVRAQARARRRPEPIARLVTEPETRLMTGFANSTASRRRTRAGSVTLIGGEPGIGKSTLLLQCAASLAKGEAVLYATGEESVRQVAERARRLAVDAGRLTWSPRLRSSASSSTSPRQAQKCSSSTRSRRCPSAVSMARPAR